VEAEAECALCRGGGPLSRSHIIPDFFYKPVYDQHRFKQVSTNPSEREVSRPTGLWERLLCSACEGRLGVWETYGSQVFERVVDRVLEGDQNFTIDVEYAPFKLFAMSLLWRAGASKRPEFAAVTLGPHQEKLRLLLDAQNAGMPYDYGFSIVFPPNAHAKRLFSHALSPPHLARWRAHHLYRFILGPTVWLFVVSNHMHNVDETVVSLSEQGALRVRSGGAPTLEFLHAFAGEIAAAVAERKPE
jgi:hypothetical protein